MVETVACRRFIGAVAPANVRFGDVERVRRRGSRS
jgi:hypothetical protein